MTLAHFWSLIDTARQATDKLADVPGRLVDDLSQLDEREIIGYGSHFQDCMHLSYDANLWLGAVVILRGCGDDKFDYFRGWLIAQGQRVFEAALADPDSLASLERFDGDFGMPVLHKMQSVAQRAFCKRVAGDDRDSEAGDRFETLFPLRTCPALRNQGLTEASGEAARVLLPRLAARFPAG